MTEHEKGFVKLINGADKWDAATQLMAAAILCSCPGVHAATICGYPRETYAQAIEKLEKSKENAPQFAEGYGRAIYFLQQCMAQIAPPTT